MLHRSYCLPRWTFKPFFWFLMAEYLGLNSFTRDGVMCLYLLKYLYLAFLPNVDLKQFYCSPLHILRCKVGWDKKDRLVHVMCHGTAAIQTWISQILVLHSNHHTTMAKLQTLLFRLFGSWDSQLLFRHRFQNSILANTGIKKKTHTHSTKYWKD